MLLNQPDLFKNLPKKKVIPEDKAKKTSKKIDANGVLKYPLILYLRLYMFCLSSYSWVFTNYFELLLRLLF